MMLFLTRRASAAPSASVAIGTAMVFVLTAATVALLIDRGGETGPGGGWMLRGALAPVDRPVLDPLRHAAAFDRGLA